MWSAGVPPAPCRLPPAPCGRDARAPPSPGKRRGDTNERLTTAGLPPLDLRCTLELLDLPELFSITPSRRPNEALSRPPARKPLGDEGLSMRHCSILTILPILLIVPATASRVAAGELTC